MNGRNPKAPSESFMVRTTFSELTDAQPMYQTELTPDLLELAD